VLKPELLVLDEPFEGLDPASRTDLVELLNRLHREQGVTLVMATHDVNVVAAMADMVYVLLRGGEIVAQGAPREIFRDPGMLRRSNIEPPVLAELFQRLEDAGFVLGRPQSLDEAVRLLGAAFSRAPNPTVTPARPAEAREPTGDDLFAAPNSAASVPAAEPASRPASSTPGSGRS
jgi:ABC-type multidrug transport system ATPase subunit